MYKSMIENTLSTGRSVALQYDDRSGELLKFNTHIDMPYKEGRFSVYAPMKNGVIYPISEGKNLDVFYMEKSDDGLEINFYKITCRIVSRQVVDKFHTFTLLQLTEPSKEQRREAYRLFIIKEAEFSRKDSEERHPLTLVNISITGIKGISNTPVKVNEYLSVYYDDLPNIPLLQTQVVAVDRLDKSLFKYEIRLQLVSNPQSTLAELRKYINLKQLESIHTKKLSDHTNDKYHLIYGPENYNQVNERLKTAVILISLVSIAFFFIFTAFLSIAMPKTEYLVFQAILNIKANSQGWLKEPLSNGIIWSFITNSSILFGLITNFFIKDSQRPKIHLPLASFLIINLMILFACIRVYMNL